MENFRRLNKDEKNFLKTISSSKEKEFGMPAMDYEKLKKKFGTRKADRISQTFFESGLMFEKTPHRLVLLTDKDNPNILVYKKKKLGEMT